MFSARRKPSRRIVRDESTPKNIEDANQEKADDDGPVVKRPGVPKTKSKLRMSFQPDEAVEEAPVVVKKPTTNLPRFTADRQDEIKPSYDKSALDELRNSTPSTPQDMQMIDVSDNGLDLAAKFGSISTSHSTIPSAAEIQEKKDRRARLAKEQGAEDFIPLEDYDSDGEFKPQRMQVGSYLDRETKDTRLVRDDEDFAEGFDEFVEDSGRVSMGKKALLEQARKERESIREMIEGSEDDESDSEAERNHAYESAQTHHGMDGLSTYQKHRQESNIPQQPRETTQIPKLAVALGRLKETIQTIELERTRIERRRAEVRKEMADNKANQEHIQKSLEEAGNEMERLQASGELNGESTPQRGLDSLGM